MKRRYILLCCLLFAWLTDGMAQKKPLDMEAYKLWRRVEGQHMSDDGKWITYRFVYIDGEGHGKDSPVTYLHHNESGKTYELENVRQAHFFNNGKCLKYVVSPSPRDTSGLVKDSVFLLTLRNMKKQLWDRPYDCNESSDSPVMTYSYPIGKNEKDKDIKRLVIWNYETGDSTVMDSLDYHILLDNNKTIIYTKERDGYKSLYAGPVKGKQKLIYGNPDARLTNFTLDRENMKGVFTIASDTSFLKDPDLLYAFNMKDGTYKLIMDTKEVVLPDSAYKVRGGLNMPFNNGRYIFVDGVPKVATPRRPKVEPDKSFELELWKWDDELSQSRQRNGRGYRRNTPKYVYHVDTKECVLVSPAEFDQVFHPTCDEYNYVIISNEAPYRGLTDWRDGESSDLYLVNLETGERKLIFSDFRQRPVWSPNGKYALFYHGEKKTWYKLEPTTGELTDISSAIGHPVYDEEHDKPKPADSYGIAGWLDGGNKVVLYDRYDMWVIDLTGKNAVYSLTNGWGRKNNTSLRLLKANYDSKWIDTKQNVLLKTWNTETLDQGVYVLTPARKIRKLMEGPYALNFNQVTNDGKYCMYIRQNYHEFRDIWWSKTDFVRPVKITDTNPQQKDYRWGSVQLVEWTNFEGKRNRGLLYLPDDYDPSKRYPVIVNFYETHTGDIHVNPVPALSSAMINVVTYVSNGYVVFMPDVHFTIGAPGESSYNAVVSGTRMLIDRGIADKDRIGIQGHSWSGYQVAYLVTRTNMFRCASPGAAVSSMVSAYTGIREGSGMPRMFMYEETQSRMGKTLWDDPEMYIKNSPIFYADKIQTPLLIFHCDKDEAVPYSEGLNLFLAMRRLQKPAWLLNYKGDKHFLYNKAAEMDWTIRLQQFFDHYLKDTPMPRWMKEGINIDERGIDQKYD